MQVQVRGVTWGKETGRLELELWEPRLTCVCSNYIPCQDLRPLSLEHLFRFDLNKKQKKMYKIYIKLYFTLNKFG